MLPVGSETSKSLDIQVNAPFAIQQKMSCTYLFSDCSGVSQLWAWLDSYLIIPHFSRCSDRLTPWEKLIGFNTKMMPSTIQVWRVFHAEMIRCIWASRCRKVFDNKDFYFFEIKSQIIARVEYTLIIYINSLQRNSKGKGISKKVIHLWSRKIPVASFQKTRTGMVKCKTLSESF
jgi:hypothetical protein